jgi:chemotaxis protein methyltransferase CheR
MTDADLVRFLEWSVTLLGLRWTGLRAFRGTVRKRLTKRLRELRLPDLAAYRAFVEREPAEAARLEAMCRIPISRLYRDAGVFDLLATELLPERARIAEREGRSAVRIWSAGCASGEEPTTLAIVWHVDVAPAHPSLSLELVATDADEGMLARAERGAYGPGSVRELPARLLERAFRREGSLYVARPELRRGITFRREDLRRAMPDGPFDVVLCRNMLLTYIDESQHLPLLQAIIARLLPGGVLVVGSRETMPVGLTGLELRGPGVYVARTIDSSGGRGPAP